ncbi:MAG: LamG-like jellyroll fold domain-containing protein [Bacillota bacterium]|nr:LamG-like jellyroll fold domain-containing protein [Bacillota bacterium]
MVIYGIVYEIEDGKAIALTMDKRFVAIKAYDGMNIGQQIKFYDSDILIPKSDTFNSYQYTDNIRRYLRFLKSKKISIVAGITVAAIFMFLIFHFDFLSKNGDNKVFAYVDIDSNTSIETAIDINGKICEVKAINNYGKILSNKTKLKGQNIQLALQSVIQELESTLSSSDENNDSILISVSLNQANEEYKKNKNSMQQKLDKILKSTDYKNNNKNGIEKRRKVVINTIIVPPEIRNRAIANNMSMGRYAIYAEANRTGQNLSMESAKNMSIGEVLNRIDINKISKSYDLMTNSKLPTTQESTSPPEMIINKNTPVSIDTTSNINILSPTPCKGQATFTPSVPTGKPSQEIISPSRSVSSEDSTNLSKDLIAWYKFDSSQDKKVLDSSGNGNDGLLFGSSKLATCLTGKSLYLDGKQGYVKLPDKILNSAKEITIATWVKINSNEKWMKIFDFGKWTKDYIYLTPRADGTNCIQLGISGSNTAQNLNGSSNLPVAVWKHIAVTITSHKSVLYINGIEDATNNNMDVDLSRLWNCPNNFIANSQNDNNRITSGQFDDFRIYKRVLSQSEIRSIINLGNPGGALQPVSAFNRIEAENFDSKYGSVRNEGSTEDGDYIGGIESEDYIVFNNVDFGSGVDQFEIMASSASHGGNIDILIDKISSKPVGSITITNTGSWENWKVKDYPISRIIGKHNLYLRFSGGTNMYRINWFKFFQK